MKLRILFVTNQNALREFFPKKSKDKIKGIKIPKEHSYGLLQTMNTKLLSLIDIARLISRSYKQWIKFKMIKSLKTFNRQLKIS